MLLLIAFFLVGVVLIALLTEILIILLKIKGLLSEVMKDTGKDTGKDEARSLAEEEDKNHDEEAEEEKKEEEEEEEEETVPVLSKREQVLKAVELYSCGVTEDDLPRIKEELTLFFSQFANGDYQRDLQSREYYRFLDMRNDADTKVVVIGDIHCDYLSLAAVLAKLSVSDYDYFEKAVFVFLGDYLDRGTNLFEPLLLLAKLKQILGDRMILLKGNHETLSWDSDKHSLKPHVIPHQSCDCLMGCYDKDESFLRQFAEFCQSLPVYVYLKTANRNILLTHASVPRDIFLEEITFNETDGEMVFSSKIPEHMRLRIRSQILTDMLWGDPSSYKEKIQVAGRFEFGSDQFERWSSRNHIDLLLRSHEEAKEGYKSFFEDKLFTIFSTGDNDNEQTGYPNVDPAFGILQNDHFMIENSFIYKVKKNGTEQFRNVLANRGYSEKQTIRLRVDDEFACDEEVYRSIRTLFKSINDEF